VTSGGRPEDAGARAVGAEARGEPQAPAGYEAGAARDPWSDGDEAGGLPPFLLDPLGVLARRWRWAAAVVLLGLAATAVVYWLWRPLYSAQATLLVSSQEIPEEFIRSTVREDSIANMDAMVGKVLARDALLQVIGQQGLYPGSRGRVSDLELVARMQKRLEVAPSENPVRGSTALVYGVTFEDESPERAANVANAIASRFVEASIARRSEQARRATELLKRELARNERELRDHLARLTEVRRAHRGELPSELETNLRKLDLASQRRNSLTAEIAEGENRIVSLTAHGVAGPESENQQILDELRRQLARELAVNTEEHPNVAALRRRIEAQEALVAADADAPGSSHSAASQQIADEKRNLDLLRSQLAGVNQQISDLNQRIDHTPVVGEQIAALEEKEQVLRQDYQDTLRKVKEAEFAESMESAQQGSKISVLQAAEAPVKPKRPRWLVLVVGIVATFGLAMVMSLLLEFVDPVVIDVRHLQSLSGRPVLGSIPTVH
jgi:protein tyrosine kinase modulator